MHKQTARKVRVFFCWNINTSWGMSFRWHCADCLINFAFIGVALHLTVVKQLLYIGVWSNLSRYTASPKREATWLVTESSLSSEFISHSSYGENFSQATGQGCLWMKGNITLCIFTYKQRIIGEGGFKPRLAYQLIMDHVFRIIIIIWGI